MIGSLDDALSALEEQHLLVFKCIRLKFLS